MGLYIISLVVISIDGRFAANIYLVKVDVGNTRTMCEIWSESTLFAIVNRVNGEVERKAVRKMDSLGEVFA